MSEDSTVSNELLRLTDLRKVYKVRRRRGKITVNAVDGVSFSIGRGEKVGIIGASGCGKTTLLKMILGLAAPTSGSIEKNAAAGFVAQDPYSSLCHALTVHEIIAEPLIFTKKRRRAAECAEEVKQAMNLVNLPYDTYAARYPHQISGGERQRVSIARAMINRPGFLALDEPTSMIDYEVKASVADAITNATTQAGAAMLMVTHDIAISCALCDTLLVMDAGKIIESGKAETIMQNPQDPRTKKLVLAASDIEAYWQRAQ
ncbi:MAG: dipeptide/oligopeptide/nickel ABC transporter ATP-binding protein [Clostridiales bacterium]|nr:dipeptide/oligopeptide/nickel ABC transporter ATP-binding protein [Clostridiales bacterium]